MTAEYGLVIAFDTDDAEFTRGWEAGQMWAEIKASLDDLPYERTIHTENAEMARRIADHYELTLDLRFVADGWADATFRQAKLPLRVAR